jgi:hypothetical protein
MAETLLAPGDIRLTDFEVPKSERIPMLGACLLAELDYMEEAHDFALEEQSKIRLYRPDDDIGMTPEYLVDLHNYYKGLLRGSGVEFTHLKTWLMHGKYENLSWHVDQAGDVRFLWNLGAPTSVEIAEEWDHSLYQPGYPTHHEPARTTELELPTGSVYAANNLVTDPNLLKPHQTPKDEPDRLVIRTSFYAQGDWEAQAIDGGVPVVLAPDSAAGHLQQ